MLHIDRSATELLGFTAGKVNVELTLHHGDPAGLRIVKPGTVT